MVIVSAINTIALQRVLTVLTARESFGSEDDFSRFPSRLDLFNDLIPPRTLPAAGGFGCDGKG